MLFGRFLHEPVLSRAVVTTYFVALGSSLIQTCLLLSKPADGARVLLKFSSLKSGLLFLFTFMSHSADVEAFLLNLQARNLIKYMTESVLQLLLYL